VSKELASTDAEVSQAAQLGTAAAVHAGIRGAGIGVSVAASQSLYRPNTRASKT